MNITEKLRQDVQTSSKNNRLKVVNFFRSSVDPKLNEGSPTDPDITIVDVETTNEEKKCACDAETEPKYVYDLYYTNSDDFGEVDYNDLIRYRHKHNH